MDATNLAQALLRGAHLISLVSLFGTLVSLATVAPAAFVGAGAAGEPARGRLVGLARWSAALGLATGVLWLMIQAALIAEANSVVDTLHALPIVALYTQFGRFMLVRFALLTTALPLVGARRPGLIIAIALTGMALGLQAAIGHAGPCCTDPVVGRQERVGVGGQSRP